MRIDSQRTGINPSWLAGVLALGCAAATGPAGGPPTGPAYRLTAEAVSAADVGGVWSSTAVPTDTDIAMVLGPSQISTPSDTYLASAYNLYLNPSGLYTGSAANVFAVPTFEQGLDTHAGLEADAKDLLDALLPALANGDHVTLFGYSQSSAAISEVLNELTAQYGDRYADDINFVLVGDSGAPGGILNQFFGSLPGWAQQLLVAEADAIGLGGAVMNLGIDNPAPTTITPDGPYHGDVFTLAGAGAGAPFPDGYAAWSPTSFTDGSWLTQLIGTVLTHETYFGVSTEDVMTALAQADAGDLVNYLTIDPAGNPLSLLIEAAVNVGWIPQQVGEVLLSLGL